MGNKIYVGNISSSTTDKDLFDLFSSSGSVLSAKVVFGIDNKVARNGYVVMADEKDFRNAISKNNNAVLKGNKIKVIGAHPIDQNSNYFSNQNRFRRYPRK